MGYGFVWAITAATLLLILIRPKRIQEAVWACSGALILVACGAISPHDALSAMERGADVYLFLTGMMVLAELARREGFFDWVAVAAVKTAKGSPQRLFAIVYAVGTIITIFLSNDATAVVLTPAVLAALKKARAKPIPYLLICAFIANAASFVLPVSNPANLVIFGSRMPPLGTWLKSFGLPSLISIAVTFAVLRFAVRKDLKDKIETDADQVKLSPAGKRAALGIAVASLALIVASVWIPSGLSTFLAAMAATGLVALENRQAPLGIIKGISWSILPLVAGLFVLVEATNQAGALAWSQLALRQVANAAPVYGALSAAFGVALLSNVVNNLPAGLLAASAIHSGAVPNLIRNALLIGVDLGPNLSVSGSLATILWLVALRRDGEDIGFWKFLKMGLLVMPPALALSVLALLLP